jgi:acyl-CoA synthetase (AMP-forming)/AMP-acid ligase II
MSSPAVLPPGEQGEIVVRGRCAKRHLDEAATAEPRRFGWHHTTDVGDLDESGFLYIVGRLKDMVNMAGLKIPAADVERVIMSCQTSASARWSPSRTRFAERLQKPSSRSRREGRRRPPTSSRIAVSVWDHHEVRLPSNSGPTSRNLQPGRSTRV